jgi:hypothetical protein
MQKYVADESLLANQCKIQKKDANFEYSHLGKHQLYGYPFQQFFQLIQL